VETTAIACSQVMWKTPGWGPEALIKKYQQGNRHVAMVGWGREGIGDRRKRM